jgi:hypothetical protein
MKQTHDIETAADEKPTKPAKKRTGKIRDLIVVLSCAALIAGLAVVYGKTHRPWMLYAMFGVFAGMVLYTVGTGTRLLILKKSWVRLSFYVGLTLVALAVFAGYGYVNITKDKLWTDYRDKEHEAMRVLRQAWEIDDETDPAYIRLTEEYEALDAESRAIEKEYDKYVTLDFIFLLGSGVTLIAANLVGPRKSALPEDDMLAGLPVSSPPPAPEKSAEPVQADDA